jgi:hypothetical protein
MLDLQHIDTASAIRELWCGEAVVLAFPRSAKSLTIPKRPGGNLFSSTGPERRQSKTMRGTPPWTSPKTCGLLRTFRSDFYRVRAESPWHVIERSRKIAFSTLPIYGHVRRIRKADLQNYLSVFELERLKSTNCRDQRTWSEPFRESHRVSDDMFSRRANHADDS